MKLQHNPPIHLTYCLNIHPGETWMDNFSAIKDKALAVREKVCPGKLFGLGLRLSDQSVSSLLAGDGIVQFRNFLAEKDLYVFTINGFPYGSFHSMRVKENVYRPDWRSQGRLDYTIKLADVLKELLPAGVTGSISTVPGSYKQWIKSGSDVSGMVRNLAECARHLDLIYNKTGREICIALEPEPDCFLETTAEAVSFFENYLLREGVENLVKASGISIERAENILRRHLGICFDTCHIALQFENLEDSLEMLARHGIRVPKVQLSSAVRIPAGPPVPAKLGPFVDKVYLHQVKVRKADGSITSHNDLTSDLLEEFAVSGSGEVRAHFHVPLYFHGNGTLGSTSDLLTPGFFRKLLASENYLEIETYTYNVLPPELRSRDVVFSIADEFEWVLKNISL